VAADPVWGSDTLEGILTLAEAEARRWRHRAPGVEHVALVMATAYPHEFAVRFGRAGRSLIEDVLRWRAPAGGLALARRALESAHTVDDALAALHDLVSPPDVVVESVERTAHERWLVLLIEDRFRSYRRRRDNVVLDELYVLIATLKVVGFPDAHEAMKARLRAVHR
jgi:hypothetical protein